MAGPKNDNTPLAVLYFAAADVKPCCAVCTTYTCQLRLAYVSLIVSCPFCLQGTVLYNIID